MHVESPDVWVDHINGNRLDNRKANLRTCSRAQNMWNSGARKTSKSGLKNIHWYKSTNRWHCSIMANGKRHSLGYFKKIEEAVLAQHEAVKNLHGKFAYSNMEKR